MSDEYVELAWLTLAKAARDMLGDAYLGARLDWDERDTPRRLILRVWTSGLSAESVLETEDALIEEAFSFDDAVRRRITIVVREANVVSA